MLPNNFLKLTFISILFFSTSIFAQTDTTLIDKGVNIFFYNGLGISYKYNANETFCYRVNVGLSTSLTDYKDDREHYYFNAPNHYDTSNYARDNYDTYLEASLSYSILYNLIRDKSFNLYLGAGPSVNYLIQKYEVTDFSHYSNYSSTHNRTYTHYGVGVVGLMGIEAYLSQKITLFAESQLTLYRNWGEEESGDFSFSSNNLNSSSKSSVSSTNWQMGFTLVKIGFGVYF